ncbi:MAG TPA: hypothetical protein V6D03_07160 [Candidatus Caenarcaniphilales bacterium]
MSGFYPDILASSLHRVQDITSVWLWAVALQRMITLTAVTSRRTRYELLERRRLLSVDGDGSC